MNGPFLGFNIIAFSPAAAAKIFDKAKEEIKIIVPDPDINFCQEGQVIHSLERAVERNVKVEIAYIESSSLAKHKQGIFAVEGVNLRKLKKPYERLLAVIDKKHVIEETKPKYRTIEIGVICRDVKSTLGHEVDSIFDELVA
jgi:hypothetical protein